MSAPDNSAAAQNAPRFREEANRAAGRESGRMQRSRAGQMHHGMTIDHLRTGR